jgi:hypothetical protein
MSQSADRHPSAIRTSLIAAFVVIVVGLGVLQARAWNGAPNADGISYLELAARYASGDLRALANGYWSPLYPALLGLAMRLSGAPGTYLEDGLAPELHVALVVNLAVLAIATAAFARLVLRLSDMEPASTPSVVRVCRTIAAAGLWIWCAIRLVSATAITPDLLLALWLTLATTELLTLTREPPTPARMSRLALILALGYWTKAVFFPLVIVATLVVVVLAARTHRRVTPRWIVLAPLALCAPLVLVQSLAQEHLTFGETGRLNYDWYVNEVPRLLPRAERASSSQRAGAPPSVVRTSTGPVLLTGDEPGSFPFWHDPTRFSPRRPVVFSIDAQARVVRANAHWFRVVAGTFVMLCVVAGALAALRQRVRLDRLLVAAPALGLLGLHWLTHPEGRMAGAAMAIAMLLMVYLGGELRPGPPRTWRLMRFAECAALVMVAVFAIGRASNRVSLAPRPMIDNLAGDLARHGLRAGDRVGLVGSPYGHYWARAAGVRIVLGIDDSAATPDPSSGSLFAMAGEACARGVPVAAILWHGETPRAIDGAEQIAGGWTMWRTQQSCETTPLATR